MTTKTDTGQRQRIKNIKDSARRSGFGFVRSIRDSNSDSHSIPRKKSKETTLRFIDMIDSELNKLDNEEDKSELLDDLKYNLGGLLACIDDSLGHGYRPKNIQFPEDLLNVLHRYHLIVFDHHDRERIDGDIVYITNPYDAISSGVLEDLTKDLKEIGYEFSVSAESNYFPTRTLRFEFKKDD